MTDNPQREDPSLGSFGRHLLGGAMLGFGVGASWEVMAWLWAPGQFAPPRLLILGASLGLFCGFVTWFARAGQGSRGNDAAGPRRQLPTSVASRDSVARHQRAGRAWKSFWVQATKENLKGGPASQAADPIGPGKHPGQPPPAFEHRLAQFLHCTAEELLRPRPRPQSKMPFWSIVDFRSYCGPKPVWIIRRILERIRATVRRSRI